MDGFKELHPGPVDSSILHLQSEHRSTVVWRVGGGDAMRCRRRNPNQNRLPSLHRRMIPLLQTTGFYGIARVASLQLDWSLITALVERWRPETHTFHLPTGECTITLQDVAILLGLPVDGDAVISPTQPGMSWGDIVASVFGQAPPKNRFNGSRLQLSWFETILPNQIDDDTSDEVLGRYTRFYLLELIAGSMFTDHSGGLVHCMWIPYLRDLDVCGRYAWGAALLAFLYRELCKGCRKDVEEVAGCLILLQLWAWERLPTIAPLRSSHSLVDDVFWDAHPAGPLGVRWLVRHSFSENGRSVSIYRVALDELAPSQFIWQPYGPATIDKLPTYCLAGQSIWRYNGPLICIFIVEPHMTDRVLRQFGMVQYIPLDANYSSELHKITLKGNQDVNWVQRHQACIIIWNSRLENLAESVDGDGVVPEYQDWYVNITRRFHSRLGALHGFIGDLLKNIAERTLEALPDVSLLASEGWQHVQRHSHGGLFEAFPFEDRRQKETEGRKDPGRRPKRGGHRGGRGGVRAKRCGHHDDLQPPEQVVPVQDDVEYNTENLGHDQDALHVEGDYDATHDGDAHDTLHTDPLNDHDPVLEKDHDTEQRSNFVEYRANVPHVVEGEGDVPHVIEGGADVQGKEKRPKKTKDYPTFFLLTPSDESLSSQSTQPSSNPPTQIEVTDAPNFPMSKREPSQKRFEKIYEPRRSKRVHKSTKCGTAGHKVLKHP